MKDEGQLLAVEQMFLSFESCYLNGRYRFLLFFLHVGLLAGRGFVRCVAAAKGLGENLAAGGGNADRMFILRR